MVRIFDPVVREVEKLVLDQAVRVKLERVKAGQPPAIKVIPNQALNLQSIMLRT